MKHLKYILISIPMLFLVSGCDELEELIEEEFDIQTTFITELEINVPNASSPDEAVDFTSNFGFWDFRNDPNVKEVISDPDEITKIEIKSVRYFYKDVVGNENANVVGDMVFVVGQGEERYGTVQTNLKNADFNNTAYTLNGNFGPVNQALTQFKTIGFTYQGSVSDNPVRFITDVSITVTVTIKPDIDNF
ncbi:hypothetical protein H7U19_00420 [Hyunsoonleella sp. SJ7]|uniref:Uncharacterized protein n=1 Tax=Hyunsoonleella aquatilis TaxID=2762758 RepID=A0A923KJ32_9FLAO|nr:hypothetical protein [Hyunsoonleella aquatilis]MBC3756847.1 hypothetical protein [Hyunsoonleella aquatilis]